LSLNGFVSCPFCRCVFLAEVDLELHLARFGRDAVLHMRSVNRVHLDAEMALSREQGGADKVVQDLADAVFGWNRFARIRKKRV